MPIRKRIGDLIEPGNWILPCLFALVMPCASHAFWDGMIDWKIHVEKGKGTGGVCFLPHSDEWAALKVAQDRCSTVVWVDCNNKRMCSGIDPNRYFIEGDNCQTLNGDPRERQLTPNEKTARQNFTNEIFRHFANQTVVLALHNNKGLNGGSGRINIRNPYSGAEAIGKSDRDNPADVAIFGDIENNNEGFRKCLGNRPTPINQLFEAAKGVGDCSMSRTAAAKRRPYLNLDFHNGERQGPALTKALGCIDNHFQRKTVEVIPRGSPPQSSGEAGAAS